MDWSGSTLTVYGPHEATETTARRRQHASTDQLNTGSGAVCRGKTWQLGMLSLPGMRRPPRDGCIAALVRPSAVAWAWVAWAWRGAAGSGAMRVSDGQQLLWPLGLLTGLPVQGSVVTSVVATTRSTSFMTASIHSSFQSRYTSTTRLTFGGSAKSFSLPFFTPPHVHSLPR
jgi:hypothetical protein